MVIVFNEFSKKKLEENKNNRQGLLDFYEDVSKVMCEMDGFLGIRTKLEEVVSSNKLAIPSAEMLSSVKSMNGVKLLIERTISN